MIDPMKIERIRTYQLRTELSPAAIEPLARVGAIIEVLERPGLGLEVNRVVRGRYALPIGETKR
jgi:hypothetical protein